MGNGSDQQFFGRSAGVRAGAAAPGTEGVDRTHMARALALAAGVRSMTTPNPWVGAVVVADGGQTFEGATTPPGGPHAEIVALDLAAAAGLARGATLYTTLEPCAHHGRTPPCTEAIIDAGIARAVIGVGDPDPRVSGRGIVALRVAGIEVDIGVAAVEVTEQLAPYLKHRRTGRPWVVLKLASTLDGRTAAPDRTRRWITGDAARRRPPRAHGPARARPAAPAAPRRAGPGAGRRPHPAGHRALGRSGWRPR